MERSAIIGMGTDSALFAGIAPRLGASCAPDHRRLIHGASRPSSTPRVLKHATRSIAHAGVDFQKLGALPAPSFEFEPLRVNEARFGIDRRHTNAAGREKPRTCSQAARATLTSARARPRIRIRTASTRLLAVSVAGLFQTGSHWALSAPGARGNQAE